MFLIFQSCFFSYFDSDYFEDGRNKGVIILHRCVFISFIESPEVAAYKARQLDFEVPKNFHNPDRFKPSGVPDEVFASVPNHVGAAVFEAMDINVPLDPMSVFLYLKEGRLAHFVVIYFMELQGLRRNISQATRFFRAMHFIDMYRSYVMVPPTHYLASLGAQDKDAAAAAPTQDEDAPAAAPTQDEDAPADGEGQAPQSTIGND